ncbi:MAG: hypothetical protein RBR68_13315 [Tenuifilaceae bacterium]|nr:hypothetical protein [Tenuifilaceae bacterium]
MGFNLKDIIYKPARIFNDNIEALKKASASFLSETEKEEAGVIADKLLSHIKLIDKYVKQIEALDYLIDNAEKLAGNIIYETDDENLAKSIQAIGGSSNIVDFKLFKEATSIILQTYEDMAILALTGKKL